MYLKQLEIQGFKSFAHKTILEFEPGITSVVGPNGAGKSNLADAIRWVLGEQSLKAIRSKKSDDVIFAGSDKKSKLSLAEVAITFDNTDRRLPLDYSEAVIARRVFRDGEGEYLINQQPTRLMDIVEILSKSGYGNTSYQIISQGTIDQMVIAGPVAIKNVIEEASGVKNYFIKRERAVRKLERTEGNLLRVSELTAEIEPRLRSLRRQTKKMAQREEMQRQLRELQVQFFAGEYQKIQHQQQELERKAAGYDEQLSRVSAGGAGVASQVKVLEQQLTHGVKDYAQLQEQMRVLERKKNQISAHLAEVRASIKANVPPLAADQHLLKQRAGELTGKLERFTKKIKDFQDQSVLGEKSIRDYQKIYSKLESDLAKLQRSLEQARSPFELNQLKEEIEKVYSSYQSLLYQIKNLQSEEDFHHLTKDAKGLEVLLVKLKDRFVQYAGLHMDFAEVLKLHSQLQQLFSQKEQVQSQVVKLTAEADIASRQQEFFRAQAAEAKEELEALESKLRTLQQPQTTAVSGDDLGNQETTLGLQLQVYLSDIEKLDNKIKNSIILEAAQKKELLRLERDLRGRQDDLAKIKDQKGLVLVEKAREEAYLENLFAEIRKNLGQDFIEKIKMTSGDQTPGLEARIAKLKAQLDLIGGVDELTMQEYKETEERYNYLTTQSEDLRAAVKDLKQVITQLDLVIKKQFENGFEKIDEQFGEYFRILFSGGRARMSLIKESVLPPASTEENGEEEQLTESHEEIVGIDIKATPPGKKLATLSALSGGERSLTAIALLMAILTAFPSPFVVLDEVDAALDEANSIRFAKILSRLAHQTQFITITHNRETMRQSQALYGVTMGDDGVSKVLSIKLDKAVEIAQ